MNEFYLLDKDLQRKHSIDRYSSAIWTQRYNEIGDCEIVIQATANNLQKIKESKYIAQEDDDMVCEISQIEIKTDETSGNQIIITGTDIKNILNQRIVETQTNFNGLVEDYIRLLINDAIINPTNSDRKISNFVLANKVGFTEKIRQQVTYDCVGEKIQELCKQFNWGYKITIKNGKFVFSLYKGNDISQYIEFSPDFDNISKTDYISDNSNIKNVAIIAGEGEGIERTKTTIGQGSGINRKELYVDARDVSSKIDYDELKNNYPNGTTKTVNNITYYQVDGTNIAILTYDENNKIKECNLCKDIYTENLQNTGYDKMTDFVQKESFTGEVTNVNYAYKKDYNIGDIIRISNEFGIDINARITEIIESEDQNGYKIVPTFEYLYN